MIVTVLFCCRLALPNGDGFAGCIKNLTFTADGKRTVYDLGSPADGENFTPGCNEEFVAAVTAINLNMNFLIAILVCLAIIMIAVVGMAVYRRKRHVFGYVLDLFFSFATRVMLMNLCQTVSRKIQICISIFRILFSNLCMTVLSSCTEK